MAIPERAPRNKEPIEFEAAEMKKRLNRCEAEDSLSEWELARSTSKTWSMEQD